MATATKPMIDLKFCHYNPENATTQPLTGSEGRQISAALTQIENARLSDLNPVGQIKEEMRIGDLAVKSTVPRKTQEVISPHGGPTDEILVDDDTAINFVINASLLKHPLSLRRLAAADAMRKLAPKVRETDSSALLVAVEPLMASLKEDALHQACVETLAVVGEKAGHRALKLMVESPNIPAVDMGIEGASVYTTLGDTLNSKEEKVRVPAFKIISGVEDVLRLLARDSKPGDAVHSALKRIGGEDREDDSPVVRNFAMVLEDWERDPKMPKIYGIGYTHRNRPRTA